MGFWSSRTVLVTGGASFIGSHLTEQLVAAGAKVRVADDLSSGKRENLDQVAGKIEFLEGDLRDRAFAAKACTGRSAVFHLAASHGGRGYIDTHPVECAGNMVLDGAVFDAAHKAGVERVCFTSSACVYPTNLQAPPVGGTMAYLEESQANPFEPGKAFADGEYGWAKLMGEMALGAYHKQYGMKASICRLFTAYGPRENETHAVIALIAKAMMRLDPYPIWGTGQQDRNFTFVDDIATGLMLAAERIEDGSPVNIGTAEHIKIVDAAKMICELMDFAPKEFFFDTTKPVGVFSRAADLGRSRKRLAWEPRTSFRDGLKSTIAWYVKTHDKQKLAKGLETLLTER